MIQRWLGLADIQIQTASGSAGAELVIEGFKEFETIRDFLYARMRGTKNDPALAVASLRPADAAAVGADDDAVTLLLNIRDELRRTRELLEARELNARASSSSSDV
jgi:putative membrane protein